jgi:hypothetical protein
LLYGKQHVLSAYIVRLQKSFRSHTTFFIYLLNQQSEYKVFYELMCWLGLVCRLTSVMRSPPARSRRPCYRSAGHRVFNLRMRSSRGRGWSSGFGCDASFVRCLILLSWMTCCCPHVDVSTVHWQTFLFYFISSSIRPSYYIFIRYLFPCAFINWFYFLFYFVAYFSFTHALMLLYSFLPWSCCSDIFWFLSFYWHELRTSEFLTETMWTSGHSFYS